MTTPILLGNHSQFANSQQAIFNPRELFGANEQGLWLDPSDMTAGKAAWRRNLLLNTEPADSTGYSFATNISFVTESAFSFLPSAGRAAGYGDGSVNRRLQFSFTSFVTGQSYTLSFYIYLDGGVEPNQGTGSYRDFTITRDGADVTNYANITYDNIGGGVYRVKHTWTHTGAGNSITVWKYAGLNTNTNFRASGFQLELGSSPTEYQRITDFSTEFKAAFPTHTLYQDSSGVTPCTAAGDPVGLIIDQSRGGLSQIGAELLVNGGFDADANWTKDSGWTITGGVAVATNATTLTAVKQSVTTVAGRMYRLEFTCVTYTTGLFSWRVGGSVYGAITSATGKTSIFFSATASSTEIAIVQRPGSAPNDVLNATFDNISVREVPGNHAYQTTSASRPTLARIPASGRRNLLTRTEEFDNAVWTKVQCSISANNSTAPDGTSTADLIVEDSTTNARYVQQAVTTTVQSYTFSVYLKNPAVNGRRYALLYHNESVKGWAFDLQNGVVGAGGTTAVGAPAAYGIESVGNGWYRCYITITGTAASNQFRVYPINNNGSGNASYSGDGVSGILVWGAQLETGSTATNYQKVVATTDVTESGVSDLWHLVFDGSDDSLVTNAVDFSATDEMTVIAGVRKLSDAASATLVEASADAGANSGAFAVYAPRIANAAVEYRSRGTLTVTANEGIASAAPTTLVFTGQSDISDDSVTVRKNGVQAGTSAGDQGTGNYGNYQLFIGRRNQATLPFNGHLYQLIVRGKTTPTGKLLEAEKFVSKKTGVNL